MRKYLLLVASIPLLVAPPAFAGEKAADDSCRPPKVRHVYDTVELAVHVKLPATGCPSREHSIFSIAAGITRTDFFGPQESVWRSLRCGPFLRSGDRDPQDPPAESFCELDVTMRHYAQEFGDYEIEVVFPGAGGDERLKIALACRSDGEGNASCDR